MSTPFQNRLVGTIIVAAAAVIFLPEFLDGEKKAYQSQFEEIPPAPDALAVVEIPAMNEQALLDKAKLEPVSQEQAMDDEAVTTSNPASDTPLVKDQSAKTTIAEPAKTNAIDPNKTVVAKVTTKPSAQTKVTGKAAGWVIQLGSFRHKNNVEQLQQKLRKAGYTVFTRPVKTQTGTLTKVFIGPAVNKALLEAELSKLQQLTGVQGRIAKFDPLS
ncbi:dedD protein [Thalassotalea litorea]|uniref:DedD protein n=1 Tax=Thalassotalea litorea TaxID=2020715 RepID=A0A5R9IJG0_9GAMM|nr:SPOR domain-containing protein [Thalassotalea litorea]TLU64217.1 dedD protein [Thalassotalea litorea]